MTAPNAADPALPKAQGLYDPAKEHDSCGVGFVADLHNRKRRDIVEMGLQILLNLDHRGAVGADPKLGDGCGILVQIQHRFFVEECEKLGFALPAAGHYAIGQLFMPRDAQARAKAQEIIEGAIVAQGLQLLGWRSLPVDPSDLGDAVRAVEPVHLQAFIGRGANVTSDEDFERRLYLARKIASNNIVALGGTSREYFPVSVSSRTIVYKGMVLVSQLQGYFLDLQDARFTSALALVHQRFATNTFPSWRLAHPYRFVAHNGEINTLRGNLNWMAARQASVSSPLYGPDISKLWPISYEGQSDTACFDNALEFLVRGGYSLAHAMMMLIPEAWAGNPLMDEDRKAFYEYHAALMEPWDGPAAMAFTDGRQIGATLDRNGLRPARYLVTDDGLVVMASEAGVLPIPQERIVTKWRLQPGKMLLVDLDQGRIISDDEIKKKLASSLPYRHWLEGAQIVLEDLKPVEPRASRTDVSLLDRQQAFGYTQEEVALLMVPMAVTGQEAVGSMGADTPISALSDKPKLLYTYFKQNFAQVTNPPIDPIREELVMSLNTLLGARPNPLEEGPAPKRMLLTRSPLLLPQEFSAIRSLRTTDLKAATLAMLWDAAKGP
ncbi:MAG: glutamate synthase subunit alpha, partial [Methylocystis sp.]|nr:glutamate synthase subunit alpha [Methylocystis sp.]